MADSWPDIEYELVVFYSTSDRRKDQSVLRGFNGFVTVSQPRCVAGYRSVLTFSKLPPLSCGVDGCPPEAVTL
jgi:hypothetical protein